MELAVITETFYPFYGGSAKRYYEVLRRLIKKGYNVDLYTVRLKKDWKINENIDGINVFRTEQVMNDFITNDGFRSITKVLLFTLYSIKKVKVGNYKLVELNHCPIFPVLIAGLNFKFKTPMSVTFHEVWHSYWYEYVPKKVYSPIGICLEKFYVKLPDIAVAVSKTTASRLISLLKVNKNIVKIVPNGVDYQKFKQFKIERDNSRIIYVGRLNSHKKVEWLIEAFKRLKKEFNSLHLDIVGDGPLKNFYEDYARKKGVYSHITFHGRIEEDNLIRLLKSAYVYVLPSIREGQSITTLEAMAAGTPQVIVECDNNGAVELINESKSGLIAKPSPISLADSIRVLIEDKHLWLNLQSNGLNYVKQFSWDKAAEEYHKIYRGISL
ncbi:MAG: glycosyltransferase family 4 protein [Nitrososphaeria archaeon]